MAPQPIQSQPTEPMTTLRLADGKEYTLILNANAFAELEELLGINFLEGTFRPDSAVNIRAFIWACMEERYPHLSLTDVGALLHWGQLPQIIEAIGILMSSGVTAADPNSLAPYVPTPEGVLARAIEISGLTGTQSFCDLGCGDGRSLKLAAAATAGEVLGYETNAERYGLCTKLAAQLNSTRQDCGQVTIRQEDVRQYTGAHDVVFVYLLTSSNRVLQPLLLQHLPVGSRVVTHAFPMPGWRYSKYEIFEHEERAYALYVYEIGKHV